jgi:hypothetical protein
MVTMNADEIKFSRGGRKEEGEHRILTEPAS